MDYSNEKIERLIKERDQKISELNHEIKKEIDKEKAKHKFSWERFALMIALIVLPHYHVSN